MSDYKSRVQGYLDVIIVECMKMVREQVAAFEEGQGDKTLLHMAYANLNTAVYIRAHLPR